MHTFFSNPRVLLAALIASLLTTGPLVAMSRHEQDRLNTALLDAIAVNRYNYGQRIENTVKVTELLAQGAQINTKVHGYTWPSDRSDSFRIGNDFTPLECAVAVPDPIMVELLLEQGADPNTINRNERTPLIQMIDDVDWSSDDAKLKIINLLLACPRTNVNMQDDWYKETALHRLIKSRRLAEGLKEELLTKFMAHPDIKTDIRNRYGELAFDEATSFTLPESVTQDPKYQAYKRHKDARQTILDRQQWAQEITFCSVTAAAAIYVVSLMRKPKQDTGAKKEKIKPKIDEIDEDDQDIDFDIAEADTPDQDEELAKPLAD